ncbi:MAG TPA: hypothetical protein VFZ66_01820 [Herpetosiphonaceae bacterium]
MQHITLFFLFIAALVLSSPNATITAQPVAPQLQIREAATGVRITVAGTDQATWPTIEIGGTEIPAQLVVVHLAHTTPAHPLISTLDCRPWAGQLRPSTRPIPQANGQARPDLTVPSKRAIPTTPITRLREGMSRGQRLAVFAVVSIFEHEGRLCQLTHLEATIPGAQRVGDTMQASTTWWPSASTAPTNPAASRPALRVLVREAGMQHISGAALTRNIPSGTSLDPARLHLAHAGQDVAIQLIGAADGRLDADDELRFYAPEVGDRWNAASTYWLTVEDQPGRRMAVRAAGAGSAPLRTTAQESGRWQPRAIYDSTLPGPDGDHWFAAELRSGPEQAGGPISIPLTATLPRAAGPVTITLTGSAYTTGPHRLELLAGAATASVEWIGTGDWRQTVTLDTDAPSVEVMLLAGAAANGIEIDQVQWTRPVALEVEGQGATFQGEPGSWRYELHGIANDQALYDVTDPAQPVQLTLEGGSFEDGPEPRRYLVTGATILHTPEVQRHQPIDLVTPRVKCRPQVLNDSHQYCTDPLSAKVPNHVRG